MTFTKEREILFDTRYSNSFVKPSWSLNTHVYTTNGVTDTPMTIEQLISGTRSCLEYARVHSSTSLGHVIRWHCKIENCIVPMAYFRYINHCILCTVYIICILYKITMYFILFIEHFHLMLITKPCQHRGCFVKI